MHPVELALGCANARVARLYLWVAVALKDYKDAKRRGCTGLHLMAYAKRLRLHVIALVEYFPEQQEAYLWAVDAGVN